LGRAIAPCPNVAPRLERGSTQEGEEKKGKGGEDDEKRRESKKGKGVKGTPVCIFK